MGAVVPIGFGSRLPLRTETVPRTYAQTLMAPLTRRCKILAAAIEAFGRDPRPPQRSVPAQRVDPSPPSTLTELPAGYLARSTRRRSPGSTWPELPSGT